MALPKKCLFCERKRFYVHEGKWLEHLVLCSKISAMKQGITKDTVAEEFEFRRRFR